MCRALDPVDKAGPELLCTEKGRVGGWGAPCTSEKRAFCLCFTKTIGLRVRGQQPLLPLWLRA